MSFLGEKNFSHKDQENIGILIILQTVILSKTSGLFKSFYRMIEIPKLFGGLF